ncbi:MAG: hypothetical protein ACFB0B_16630 [Thermonemataceae bacterium]
MFFNTPKFCSLRLTESLKIKFCIINTLQNFHHLYFYLPLVHFSLMKNEPKNQETELASSAKLNPKLLPTNPPTSPLDFQAYTLTMVLETRSWKKFKQTLIESLKSFFFMKHIVALILACTLCAVGKAQDTYEEEYLNAYVVIADTSNHYFTLKKQMFALHESLSIEIDTLGRGFNIHKNLICLPEDDEDELYAGSYFPRRYASNILSLEYLNFYTNEPEQQVSEKTIVLVVLISGNLVEAQKRLRQITPYAKNAFIINTKLYQGCMH